MKILHIVNGASLAGTLRQTGKATDITYWHEALYLGSLELTDDSAFAQQRMKYWSKEFPPTWVLHTSQKAQIFSNLTSFIPTLKSYDQIWLWFEFDLYDQTMLWYILRQFKLQNVELPTYLISPDSYSGIDDFRGMGQLNPVQLTQLFGTEKLVTEDQFKDGKTAWEVFAKNNKAEIEEYLQKPNSLPFTKRALTAHLAQIPQPPDGLGDIQQQILNCIRKNGEAKIYKIIGEVMGKYNPDYGLSDTATLEWLLALNREDHTLIEYIRDGEVVDFDKEKVKETSVRLIK